MYQMDTTVVQLNFQLLLLITNLQTNTRHHRLVGVLKWPVDIWLYVLRFCNLETFFNTIDLSY
jgi:hypothetical protein